jgi:replicative DNA helicase
MQLKKKPGPRTRTPGNKSEQLQHSISTIEFNRVLPENIEAESALLHHLIGWPEGICSARAILSPCDFSRHSFEVIFSTLCRFDDQGRTWVPSSLSESYNGHPEQEHIQGLILKLGPFWMLRDAGLIRSYSKIVKEQAIRRDSIKALVDGAENLFSQGENPLETLITVCNITTNQIKRFKEVDCAK